ncbi:MAG TPA: oxidoreductase [Sphingobacteriaceae bacterium]
MAEQKIWFITGVSGGLGRALAEEVAKNDDIVIGTLRQEKQLLAFEQLVPGKTFAARLDVNDHAHIDRVIQRVMDEFGRIDVLVNNAGYGLFGAIEEVSMEEARRQMETNFFSALALTKAVLPIMRNQRSGNIVQISSMAGFRSNPGMGIYNASKFALEGFSEALYLEMAPLNIHVTLVEPGPFRTEWAGASSVKAASHIPDYGETAGKIIGYIESNSGKQAGDPVKAARAIIRAVNNVNPPLRLPLGKAALDAIRTKLRSVGKNIEDWEDVSLDTSFEEES